MYVHAIMSCIDSKSLKSFNTDLSLTTETCDGAHVVGIFRTSCHTSQDLAQIIKFFLAPNKGFCNRNRAKIVARHLKLDLWFARITPEWMFDVIPR